MNSRERMLTAIHRGRPDHVPLWCPCFGFAPPPHLQWRQGGQAVPHWFTMRLEHDHTLPEPWSIEHDYERAKGWLSLGIDDILEVSPPWSLHPQVRVRDWQEPPSSTERYPLIGREYETPVGPLRHIVRKTDETQAPGWVVQPDYVALFEDFNVGRAVKHAIAGSEDLARLPYLLHDPTAGQLRIYRERMARVRRFADELGVLVQGWSAFGMDGIVDLCGVEQAVIFAMTEPDFFQELIDALYAFDRRRTEILLDVGGIDGVVQYGWYASVNFWSPSLLRRFVLPHLRELVALAHQAGAYFAYVMTTGVLPLADQLLESGVDVLYFVDNVQDNADLSMVRARFAGRMAVAGGVNAGVTLARGTPNEISQAVQSALQTLGPAGGFILAPVDALFPDTPWSAVETMINTWREMQGL